MFHWKSKKIYWIFLTRKDFHHLYTRPQNILVWYKKKKYRKIANRKVRRFNGYFSNWEYKKIWEVKREVI
jgi:hypothetical protein